MDIRFQPRYYSTSSRQYVFNRANIVPVQGSKFQPRYYSTSSRQYDFKRVAIVPVQGSKLSTALQ
jgi:hypothetical protein